MDGMFQNCHMFNQPLHNWVVNQVEDMDDMFRHCKNLLQDFSMWNISCDPFSMFDDTLILRQHRNELLPPRLIDSGSGSDSGSYSGSDSGSYSGSEDYDDFPPPPRPPSSETQARSVQAESKARQAEIDSRVKKRALEEVQETSEFPECIICGDLLNNMEGPGTSNHCQVKCNDAIKVCGSGHIFHRGCILEACNAAPVTIVRGYSMNQERRFKCPICQKPLTGVNPRIGCNALRNITVETEEALKEYKRQTGGKKRRLTKKNKRQYKLTKKRKHLGKYRKTGRNKK
jgi:hypothetical protein